MSEAPRPKNQAAENQADLGLGRVLAQESAGRFVNKDGSFNSRRTGLSFWASLNPYYALITLPWWGFGGLVVLGYLLVNVLFALAYLALGPNALAVAPDSKLGSPFLQAFFFSVQTFATIGYGKVTPEGVAANALVTLEALVGLLGVALATGIVFARFSRPMSRVIFSERAVVAPYQDGHAWMFRVVNGLRTQLIDLEAEVTLSRFEGEGEGRSRRFYSLELARQQVAFFPLAWTVVHPIDENSPLSGVDARELASSETEFLVLLRGMDDTLFQTVRARTSYRAAEVTWNAKFASMYRHDLRSVVAVDVNKLSDVERVNSGNS